MEMTLAEALTAAIEDEYRARATYRAVLAEFGDVLPFANIVESEERHVAALEVLFRRHGVPIPPDHWAGRIEAPPSLLAACRDGVEAERANAVLYERLIEAAQGHADAQETFRRLLSASQENHLPAFERCVGREQPGGGSGGRGRGRRRRRRGGG